MREAEAGGTNGNLPVLMFGEIERGKCRRVTCIGRKASAVRGAEAGGTNDNSPALESRAGPKNYSGHRRVTCMGGRR